MTTKDDELINLIARCALKDEAALKALYDRLSPYLNGVVYRLVHSQALSSEVLQEGFIQVWQHAASYRPHQSKPLTWSTSIMRYRALDQLDHAHRHDRTSSGDREPAPLA